MKGDLQWLSDDAKIPPNPPFAKGRTLAASEKVSHGGFGLILTEV
jgi:hypothetical protein